MLLTHRVALPALCLFALMVFAALTTAPASAALIWWDGTRDDSPGPPGKLLSDNDGYWGDSVLTGVEYTYETEPENPRDVWRNNPDKFGRRLLDGKASGNWWVPAGVSRGPLVVVFDFKRHCVFHEVSLSTRSKQVAVKIELRPDEEAPWETAFERAREDLPDVMFHRFPLPARPEGRFLRLTVEAEGITWLEEVLAWGDAEVSAEVPEAYRPIVPEPIATEIAFSSIPGIEKTAFSDAQYWDWQRDIGDHVRQPAVWSQVPTWDSITDHPLLPGPDEIIRDLRLVMARNETEHAALALTNTSCETPRDLTVTLSEFRRVGGGPAPELEANVRVAGAIGSRHYGVNLGPLFAGDNLLSPGLMQRYLTNGAGLLDFPRLTLSPAGSAVLWLTVTTLDAVPGRYEARLGVRGGPPVIVRIEVPDVTLPEPFVWLQTWSRVTSMFPFVYADRDRREVHYKQSLGVTVWNGWPTAGTVPGLAREGGRTLHHIWGIGDYGHKLYGGRIEPEALTEEDADKIAEMIRGHVEQARELGLGYDDWYVELTDEPGKRNSPAFGALSALIRRADPNVRIYCNPSFWVGSGVMSDDDIHEALAPWYREMVDISVPLYLLLRDRPRSFELFDAPRFVRAFYTVSTQSAKSERAPQVELYRRQAWDALGRGWNGWGFYSYYAPRGNPWSDLDADWYTGEDRPDYLMVYPGPRGPIPTRQSEAVRQGWEDYRLLTLLRESGRGDVVDEIMRAYEAGTPMEALRLRALRTAAKG